MISGCANLKQDQTALPVAIAGSPAPAYQTCSRFFEELDQSVTRSAVRDSQAARIPGFPYLRVNRFLASFGTEALAETAFQAWVERMQGLAEEGWEVELSNLPRTQRQALQTFVSADLKGQPLSPMIKHCGSLLRDANLATPQGRAWLHTAARVPPNYRAWQRVVGLYPLTAVAFGLGIQRWQADTQQVFALPLAELPVHGELVHFAPPPSDPLTRAEIAKILARSAHNPLRIPEPNKLDQERLFATFAPSLEIDVNTPDDRIGAPGWNTSQYPVIDTNQPTVYRYLSYTRYTAQTLLQLNYTFWFPARPRSGVVDFLGGHVDGLTWRVTLTPDGHPWVYDAMHNCGCYHLFFPTRRALLRKHAQTLEENAFVPQTAPELHVGRGPILRIAYHTHYLQRIMENPTVMQKAIPYQWADYDTLRSMPFANNERHSLFREDGIVPGTDRLERYLFWPMGIPHPGAMRQRGHHATAFVGRRHFDDPDVLTNAFEIVSP